MRALPYIVMFACYYFSKRYHDKQKSNVAELLDNGYVYTEGSIMRPKIGLDTNHLYYKRPEHELFEFFEHL